MAQRSYRNPRHKVEIALAFARIKTHSLTALQRNRRRGINGHQMLARIGHWLKPSLKCVQGSTFSTCKAKSTLSVQKFVMGAF